MIDLIAPHLLTLLAEDLLMTPVRAMIETAVSVGVGVSTVGGMALWFLREKIGAWVDERVTAKVTPEADRIDQLEARMVKAEEDARSIAQSLENTSRNFEEGMRRLTQAIEKVVEEVTEQGKGIARIEGTIERRHSARSGA